MEEYLTITEVAQRLKIKPKTVKNKMALGTFRQGVHYFRPPGMQVRFKWSAVVDWLEKDRTVLDEGNSIPMPRSYGLKRNQNAHLTGLGSIVYTYIQ